MVSEEMMAFFVSPFSEKCSYSFFLLQKQQRKPEVARFYERCEDRMEYGRGELAHQRPYCRLDA